MTSRSDHGSRACTYPSGFERDDDDVWAWFADHLLETAAADPAQVGDDDRSPYPGLAAFTAADRACFVGMPCVYVITIAAEILGR